MSELQAVGFDGLVDLAAHTFGGRALAASDEFFAAKENLLLPGRGVFVPERFTEQGKWMDGWESRRKRMEGWDAERRRRSGHDACIIELGAAGSVLAVDIDTHHFLGNHPAFACLEGVLAPRGAPLAVLEAADWTELVAQAPLRAGSQNLFVSGAQQPVSHVRLNIFPDGGVARLRVYGRVVPDWSRRELDERTRAELGSLADVAVDLAALSHGARALACSDAFFAPMHHLIAPGRAETQAGGWETRRKRAPGHDWIIVQLAARGRPRLVEIDTHHFKGNYPDRCALEACDAAAGSRITELIESDAWVPLIASTPLTADQRHFFSDLRATGSATHVRLRIYPDGGVSRLRIWGERDG